MNTGKLLRTVLLSGTLALPAYAEKVKLEQLPQAVQEKIRAQVGSERIEDIDREVRNGKTVYEVAFKRNGRHTEIQVEDPGPLARSIATPTLDSRKITYGELPPEVRRVADSHLADADINDVDRQVKNGQVTYEIGYKRNNGEQQELVISDEGKILSGAQAPATRSRFPIANTASASPAARTMQYADLPASVRSAAEKKLSYGEVARVERLNQNGQTNYRIGFQREDGQFQELLVSPTGQILREQMFADANAASLARGSAAASQSGAGSSATQASEYSFVTSPVQLANSEQIQRVNLPVIVNRAVRDHAKNDSIKQIQRGEWRGKTVYHVGFTDQDNRYAEMQFDENGQVIFDSRHTQNERGNLQETLGRSLLNKNQQ